MKNGVDAAALAARKLRRVMFIRDAPWAELDVNQNISIEPGFVAGELGRMKTCYSSLEMPDRTLRESNQGMKVPAPSVFDLSPAEKLQLVEDLWDDLAANPEDVPVHDWQIVELARRKANLQRNPGSVTDWESVKRRARGENGR